MKNGHSIMVFGGYGNSNKYDPFRDIHVEFKSWNVNLVSFLNLPPNMVRFQISASKTYNFQTGEIGRFYRGSVNFRIHVSENFLFNTKIGFSEGAGLRRTISTMHVLNLNFFKRLTLRIGYENVFSESQYYQPYYRYWLFITYQMGVGGIYVAISNQRDRMGIINSVVAVKIKYFVTF